MEQQKQLQLSLFLKFTLNLTPIVDFLLYDKRYYSNFAIVEFPRLYRNLPTTRGLHMGVYISYCYSYATLIFAVCIQSFNKFTVFCLLNYLIKSFQNRLCFKTFFGRYQHLVEKYSVTSWLGYRWRKAVLTIRFWFKINYFFTIMSYDYLVYYL